MASQHNRPQQLRVHIYKLDGLARESVPVVGSVSSSGTTTSTRDAGSVQAGASYAVLCRERAGLTNKSTVSETSKPSTITGKPEREKDRTVGYQEHKVDSLGVVRGDKAVSEGERVRQGDREGEQRG